MPDTFVPILSSDSNGEDNKEKVVIEDPFFKKLDEEKNRAAESAKDDEPVEVQPAEQTAETEPAVEDVPETENVETANDKAQSNSDIIDMLNNLDAKLNDLNTLFNRKIARSESEEKIIDKLHRELQVYKDDIYIKLIKPILVDVATMRNSLLQICSIYSKKEENNGTIPLDVFETYTDDLKEILEKNTVMVYSSKEGDRFDPHRQKLVKRISTPIEELDKTVATIVGEGYEYNGQIIVYENVEVYFYKKPE